MERTRFWSRVGGWFKPPGRMDTFEANPAMDASTEVVPDVGPSATAREPDRDEEPGPVSRFRPARQEATLKRLEEGYRTVLGLVASIEGHLEQQDQRAEAVTRSLDRIADSLANWEEGTRGQMELLAAINSRLEADSTRAQRFQESLAQWPQIADAQRESMASIGRQLDQSRETSERVGTALQGFEGSVTGVGEAVTASTAAMNDLRVEASAGEKRFIDLFELQTRRLTFFSCVAIGVAAVVAITGLVTLLL